jgi:stearoyl-CoA desaturase (delta-9 desaturase)
VEAERGAGGLVVGFFWSTVLVYHATFCINSLAHVRGRRRYVTADDPRNNWLLAVFTMGEGWHNNHHAYQSSVRQGFRWWEIDPTFYILKVLSWFALVWDLKTPPVLVRRNEHRLGSRVIERAAAQLAGSSAVRIAALSKADERDAEFFFAQEQPPELCSASSSLFGRRVWGRSRPSRAAMWRASKAQPSSCAAATAAVDQVKKKSAGAALR